MFYRNIPYGLKNNLEWGRILNPFVLSSILNSVIPRDCPTIPVTSGPVFIQTIWKKEQKNDWNSLEPQKGEEWVDARSEQAYNLRGKHPFQNPS